MHFVVVEVPLQRSVREQRRGSGSGGCAQREGIRAEECRGRTGGDQNANGIQNNSYFYCNDIFGLCLFCIAEGMVGVKTQMILKTIFIYTQLKCLLPEDREGVKTQMGVKIILFILS